MGFKAFCKRTGVVIYKHRADIEFIAGVGLVTTGTVLLIKDAPKIAKAIEDHSYRAQTIEEFDETDKADPGAGWRDAEERKQFIKDDIKNTIKDYSKTVVKDCAFIIGGEVLQTVSHVSLNKQLATAVVNLATVSSAYANLKQKIVEDQGQEKLDEYLYGPQIKKVIVDEDGNVTETVELVNDENAKNNLPPHCFFFDESNPNFSKSRGVNKDNLEFWLGFLNDRLYAEGFLFENDIRRELGAELVECGWTSGIFAENLDGTRNYLSFGFDRKDAATQAFMDCCNPSYLVKLNVEDDILSKLHLRKH